MQTGRHGLEPCSGNSPGVAGPDPTHTKVPQSGADEAIPTARTSPSGRALCARTSRRRSSPPIPRRVAKHWSSPPPGQSTTPEDGGRPDNSALFGYTLTCNPRIGPGPSFPLDRPQPQPPSRFFQTSRPRCAPAVQVSSKLGGALPVTQGQTRRGCRQEQTDESPRLTRGFVVLSRLR